MFNSIQFKSNQIKSECYYKGPTDHLLDTEMGILDQYILAQF